MPDNKIRTSAGLSPTKGAKFYSTHRLFANPWEQLIDIGQIGQYPRFFIKIG